DMKNINKRLLQKYFNGECSAAEKARVEAWLASDEPEAAPLPFDEATKAAIKDSMWENITASMDVEGSDTDTDTPIIPLYSRTLRYAAAACLLIMVFFGGRFSVYATTSTTPAKSSQNHLYIAGGNGAQGHLPGDTFKVVFDGVLRLYNDGPVIKVIEVGDSTFTLVPKRTYYLRGSVKKPQLLKTGDYAAPRNDFKNLRGDFSILRTDHKR
ncbi:MAG: hypothetical protein AAGJ82_10985, partial [Bacteroidota bacterium]